MTGGEVQCVSLPGKTSSLPTGAIAARSEGPPPRKSLRKGCPSTQEARARTAGDADLAGAARALWWGVVEEGARGFRVPVIHGRSLAHRMKCRHLGPRGVHDTDDRSELRTNCEFVNARFLRPPFRGAADHAGSCATSFSLPVGSPDSRVDQYEGRMSIYDSFGLRSEVRQITAGACAECGGVRRGRRATATAAAQCAVLPVSPFPWGLQTRLSSLGWVVTVEL